MAYKKVCTGCGTEFDTDNILKLTCKRGCGRKRNASALYSKRKVKRYEEPYEADKKAAKEAHDLEFIGVDGEGVTRLYEERWDDEEGTFVAVRIPSDKETPRVEYQDYVLLSIGEKSLHKGGQPLTHRDCFRFLYAEFLENPNAVFVGFSLGYDFAMWFRTLNENAAWRLLTKDGAETRRYKNSPNPMPRPVFDGGKIWDDESENFHYIDSEWEFDVLGMKRFRLRPYVAKKDWPPCEKKHKLKSTIEDCLAGKCDGFKHPYQWMHLCDTFPFFQTSFLKVIDPKDYPEGHPNRYVSDAEWELLKKGKERRDDAQFDYDMIEYNKLENIVLARVMKKMNEGFVADGIRLSPKQWMGPGQAAQEWMALIGVPTADQVKECVPQYLLDFARNSYYGGWFEIFNHGPVPGECWNYDINSAYPAVIAELPCLLHLTVRKNNKENRTPKKPVIDGGYRLCYVTVEGKNKWIGPVPFRRPDKTILRPLNAKGWYWQHELDAAKRAGLIKSMRYHAWVEFYPNCECGPPMASIRDLYKSRINNGDTDDERAAFKNSPAGVAKKLTYNSAYGKLAQSVGMPKYSNAIYASLITAGCRTQILDAIATHPKGPIDVLMIATDGIVFKSRHTGGLNLNNTTLGAWEEKSYQNISLFMPGLYWHDKSRATIRDGGDIVMKSRGVNPRYLAQKIDAIDQAWRDMEIGDAPPEETIRIDRSILGPKAAISQRSWHKCAQVVRNAERNVSGNWESKRAYLAATKHHGGWRTEAYVWDRDSKGKRMLETTYYTEEMADSRPPDPEGELLTSEGLIADLHAGAFGTRF